MSKLTDQERQRERWRKANKKYREKNREKLRKQNYKSQKHCPDCGTLVVDSAKYCRNCGHKRERGASWNGGIHISSHGYRLILMPDHPHADQRGYISEHWLIMEKHLGRTLLPSEIVHHIDGNRLNNVIENLMLFSDKGSHISHHHKEGSYGKTDAGD